MIKKTLIVLGIGGIAYGLYAFYLKQLEILYLYKYKLISLNILKANLQTIEIVLNVEVVNDSTISVTITDYYFDIFLNDKKVAVIQNATANQKLVANGGKSVFPLKVSIQTKDFISGNVLFGLLESVKNSSIKQVGYFGIKKGLIRMKNIPIEYTYKVKDFM
jgi:LEA14-like dessication related protein